MVSINDFMPLNPLLHLEKWGWSYLSPSNSLQINTETGLFQSYLSEKDIQGNPTFRKKIKIFYNLKTKILPTFKH